MLVYSENSLSLQKYKTKVTFAIHLSITLVLRYLRDTIFKVKRLPLRK